MDKYHRKEKYYRFRCYFPADDIVIKASNLIRYEENPENKMIKFYFKNGSTESEYGYSLYGEEYY